MCDYRELILYTHEQQATKGRPMIVSFYNQMHDLLEEFANEKPEQCERIFLNQGQCHRTIIMTNVDLLRDHYHWP